MLLAENEINTTGRPDDIKSHTAIKSWEEAGALARAFRLMREPLSLLQKCDRAPKQYLSPTLSEQREAWYLC